MGDGAGGGGNLEPTYGDGLKNCAMGIKVVPRLDPKEVLVQPRHSRAFGGFGAA